MSCQGRSTDAKTMGFLRILPTNHLQGEAFMVIPSNFEMKNKVILPNPLFLRLPNGAEWSVSWIKRDYDIWFQQDWIKFVMDCSLKGPHFIVFKYEGGSHFEVRIFEVTTYNEIEYSSIRCTNDATKNHYIEVESDNSVEIIEIDDDSDEIVENEIHSMLPKKRKINTKGEHISDIKLHFESNDALSSRKLNKTKNNVDFDATQKKVSPGSSSGRVRGRNTINGNSCSKSEATAIQKELVMDKARDCINKTKKPAFIQLLFPAYVNPKRDVLGINSVFAKEYLKGFEGKATIGVLHEKKTWPVRININHCTGQTSMTGGWKSFWQHYKLQVNDVCVFEMTQHTPLSFKVIIFPAREVHKELQGYGNEAHQHPPQREKKIKIYIGNNHLRSTPNIPIDFLKRYPKCDGKDVKLQVGEEWWVVKLIYYPHYCFGRFSRGWYAFMRECKLEVENNWEFDMIDEENLVFKVSISN